MTTANDNEALSECEAHAERMIDEALALAAEDIGNGPLEPRTFLIELAARAIACAVLTYEVIPEVAVEMAHRRAVHVMKTAVEQHEARLPPAIRLVETQATGSQPDIIGEERRGRGADGSQPTSERSADA